jgi:hypothetical protein
MKFALFHRLHGIQPLSHRQVRRVDTGWYSIEWGSWTLEIEVSEATEHRVTRILRTIGPRRPTT